MVAVGSSDGQATYANVRDASSFTAHAFVDNKGELQQQPSGDYDRVDALLRKDSISQHSTNAAELGTVASPTSDYSPAPEPATMYI